MRDLFAIKRLLPFRMPGQPARYGFGQGHLEIEAGLIARDDRQAEALECSRYIGQLELDRATTAANLLLQKPVLGGLVVGSPR